MPNTLTKAVDVLNDLISYLDQKKREAIARDDYYKRDSFESMNERLRSVRDDLDSPYYTDET